MKRLSILLAFIGAGAGFAIVALAHSGDGFQSGPLVFLALVLSGLGTLAAGALFIVGKRGALEKGVASFCAAMLLALVVLPIIWPYPTSSGPTPLSREDGSQERK